MNRSVFRPLSVEDSAIKQPCSLQGAALVAGEGIDVIVNDKRLI